MNRRDLITNMVSGLLGTLVLPARLRNFLLRPKPIPEVVEMDMVSTVIKATTMADIKKLRNKIALALRIPAEYLEPPTAEEQHKLRAQFIKASNEIHRHRLGIPAKILQMDDTTKQALKDRSFLVSHKDSLSRRKK